MLTANANYPINQYYCTTMSLYLGKLSTPQTWLLTQPRLNSEPRSNLTVSSGTAQQRRYIKNDPGPVGKGWPAQTLLYFPHVTP